MKNKTRMYFFTTPSGKERTHMIEMDDKGEYYVITNSFNQTKEYGFSEKEALAIFDELSKKMEFDLSGIKYNTIDTIIE